MYKKYAVDLAAQQTMRSRLLRERRDDLVILCIRDAALCAAARLLLRPEHFTLADERPHAVTMNHLWALLDGGDYLPGAVPRAALYDAIAQALVGLGEAEVQQPWVGEILDDPAEPGWEGCKPGLLARAYSDSPLQYDRAYAFETLKLFLTERAVADKAAGLVAQMGPRVPHDLTSQLRAQAELAERIEAIGKPEFMIRSALEDDDQLMIKIGEGLGRELLGIKSGITAVDKHLNGLRGITLLSAAPGTGKTALVTQLGIGAAEHAPNDVVTVILSLDQQRLVLLKRIRAYLSGLTFPSLNLGSPELRGSDTGPYRTEDDEAAIVRGRERLEALGNRLIVLDREALGDELTHEKLRRLIAACKEKSGAKRILLVIDYFQILPPAPVPASGGRRDHRSEESLVAEKRQMGVLRDVFNEPETEEDAMLLISETRKSATSANARPESSIDESLGTRRLGSSADAIVLLRRCSDTELRQFYNLPKGPEHLSAKKVELHSGGRSLLSLKIDKSREGGYQGEFFLEFKYHLYTLESVQEPQQAVTQVTASTKSYAKATDPVAKLRSINPSEAEPQSKTQLKKKTGLKDPKLGEALNHLVKAKEFGTVKKTGKGGSVVRYFRLPSAAQPTPSCSAAGPGLKAETKATSGEQGVASGT